MSARPEPVDVLRVGRDPHCSLVDLTHRYGLELVHWTADSPPPGSYWGGSEAGLRGNVLYVRPDTPLHSLLHELSHFVCMSPRRRAALDRDAGGDDDEESAVCYLQVLLAAELPTLGQVRMLRDMDAWGYTFRLGSAAAWFETDAADARQWLHRHGIVDEAGRPSFLLKSLPRESGMEA
jgi:hypothetical protein